MTRRSHAALAWSPTLLLLLSVGSAYAAVTNPPDPNTLRVAVFDWAGVDGTPRLWDANTDATKSVSTAFLVGAKMFNDRRSDIIPSLAGLKDCNKKILVTTYCDNGGSPLRATSDSSWVINEVGADAFAGFGGLEASMTGSMLGYVNNLPTLDHWTSAPRTSSPRRDFPWYARTIPSDDTSAIMLAAVVEQLGFQEIVFLYLSDGEAFAQYFYTILKAKGVTATLVEFKYGIDDDNIRDRVAYVKTLSLNVIVCATWFGQVTEIANAAHEFELTGPTMEWIFTYMSRPPSPVEILNTNLSALFHGSLWVRSSPLVNPNLVTFENAYSSFDADITEFNNILPPHGTQDSMYDCKNSILPATLEPGFFSKSENSTDFTVPGYAIDIMLAYGFAICSVSSTASVPTGQALWDKLMEVSFVGVSGAYVAFDNNTGDRVAASAGFVLTNWNQTQISDICEFDKDTNSFPIPADRIVFKSGVGMKNVPKAITAPYHNENFLPLWAKGLGYAELVILNIEIAIVFIFLVTKRDEKIVVNGQPPLLHVINLGCLIASWSILTLALSDDDPSGPAGMGMNLNAVCMASPILFTCGMSLTMSALNAKTYRVWRIFINAKLRKMRSSISRTVEIVFLLQFILWTVCAAWIGVAPLAYERIYLYRDSNGFPLDSSGSCTATNASGGFLIFVFFMFIFSLMVSAYAAYRVRTIPTDYHESRYVLLALMSITQIYCVAVPAVVATYSFVLGRYIILTSVVFVSILVLHMFIFFPKLFLVYMGRELFPDSTTVNGLVSVRVNPSSPHGNSQTRSNNTTSQRIPVAAGKSLVELDGGARISDHVLNNPETKSDGSAGTTAPRLTG